MAPMAPLGRDRAIAAVNQGKPPVWMGSPHPHVALVEQEGVVRIRALVVDPEEEHTAREQALARGDCRTPESYHARGRPTGRIYLEAAGGKALVARMREMTWPADW